MADKKNKKTEELDEEELPKEEKQKLEDLDDEELLKLYREGNQKARDTLSVRYFKMRKSLLARFVLDDPCFRDEWELNEAFFVAYLKTEGYYKPLKGAKFLTLMCRNLANELAEMYNRAKRRGDLIYVYSLDEPYTYDTDGEEERSFGDVISGSNIDESREHLNFLSALNHLLNHMGSMTKRTKAFVLALYEGYAFSDACAKAKISRAKGRSVIYRIKKIFDERAPGVDGYFLPSDDALSPTPIRIIPLSRKEELGEPSLKTSVKKSLSKKIFQEKPPKEEAPKPKKAPAKKRKRKRATKRNKGQKQSKN